jgi:outer membrane protein assembly factor BamB
VSIQSYMGMFVVTLLGPLAAMAENWPQWRGPAFNGSTGETGLPESCDPSRAKWVTPLPGASHATPIVWKDRVYITSTDPATKGLLAMCLNAQDGKVLWQKRLADDIKAPQNTGATPSPVTDGNRVYFLFGSGDLAALDPGGTVLWTRSLVKDYGNLGIKFGYSSSPLLWNDRLYIQILRHPTPYYGPPGIDLPLASLLLAIDTRTGKTLWKYERKTQAVDESCESYASIIPLEHKARQELLVEGGDFLSGHDPANGREIWRLEYNPTRKTQWRLVPSPVTVGNLVVAAIPRGGPLMALKAGLAGELDKFDLEWTYEDRTTDSGTPLVYQGVIYVLQSDKSGSGIFLLAIDPATGKELGRCQISEGGAWRASPTGADGKIYVMSEKGEVVVVSAGPKGRILSRSDYADGPACSTIAAANRCLYIRTAGRLTCIGK